MAQQTEAYVPAAPEPPIQPPAPQCNLPHLTNEQIQWITKEILTTLSSSGSGGNLSTDTTMVPHISLLHQTMNDIVMRQEHVEHTLNIMCGRMIHPDEKDRKLSKLQRQVDQIQEDIQTIKDSGQWVVSQVASSKQSYQQDKLTLDHLSASVERIQETLNQLVLFPQQPSQSSTPGFHYDPPRQPAPHLHQRPPQHRRRGTGSSSRPSVLSSDED